MKNNSHAEIYNALFKPKSIVVIGGSSPISLSIITMAAFRL